MLYADTLAGGAKAQSDSAVLYVACVLEYVTDLRRTMDEIMRIAGERENIYIVTVQPWTLNFGHRSMRPSKGIGPCVRHPCPDIWVSF